ncbi:MAG: nickel-type superoxide dismutase maturation protease [Chloroflexi bacterium]|nr:MAG: nickel-type superoxide dismutase maturation protease [Chloroflexota bacterium]
MRARGRQRSLRAALSAAAGMLVGLCAARLAVRWLDVAEVMGRSMSPALEPGDLLLVERLTYRRRLPRVGEIALARDPRLPHRELVKRVAAVEAGIVSLRGDNTAASTDSATFGAVPLLAVRWRARFRYWPPSRVGPI